MMAKSIVLTVKDLRKVKLVQEVIIHQLNMFVKSVVMDFFEVLRLLMMV